MSAIERFPGVTFATRGDVGMVVWNGDPTLAANKWVIERAKTDLMSRFPTVLLVQIILETAGQPDAETRRYIEEAFKTHLQPARRMVTIPIGGTLAKTIVRTIMRGMIVVAGRSGVIQISATVAEGLDSLYEKASAHTPKRPEIEALLRQMGAFPGEPQGRREARA